MKEYPKIPNSKDFPLGQCITFEKYDGSNIRAEWTKKKGFHKFGTVATPAYRDSISLLKGSNNIVSNAPPNTALPK